MYGNPGPFSYTPRDEEPRGTSLQRTMSRPTGKSIYMQRKEYAETLNRQQDSLNARVEHLLTCELDGQLLKTVEDCVAKLRRLEAKGRLWSQNMIMDIQGPFLVLSDIETKAELESIPLSFITQTKFLEDESEDSSLLILTVQDRNKRVPQVFMFQCEETSGDIVKADLDKAVQRGGGIDPEPFKDHTDIRSNLENIIGLQAAGGFRPPVPQSPEYERRPPPPDFMSPQWNNREPEYMAPPRLYNPQDDMMPQPGFFEQQNGPEIPDEKQEMERNMDIFNHIISDLEIFMDRVAATANMPQEEEKSKKKKKKSKKKKSQKDALPDNLPHWEEYASFLQKVKYGFNLLSKLDGVLTPVSAPDYVHIFFQFLEAIVPQYPSDLPPTVVPPLLTEAAIEMLGQVLGREEYRLWRSLGDCWFVPRSNWPDNVPPYIPEFYDGWQPPAPPPPLSPQLRQQNGPMMSRSNSQRFHPDGAGRMNDDPPYSPRASLRRPEEPMTNGPWNPMPPQSEPPALMRAMYNFNARNNKELSIMKGETVQVVNKAKQWWLVRNSRGEEGNVPLNLLEPASSDRSMDEPPYAPRNAFGPVTLGMNSSPGEVKAWLEYKGFSRITATSLGVLSGRQLLGMSKEELRAVCPEEAAKVFFQLQGIKSSIAVSSVSLYKSDFISNQQQNNLFFAAGQ
uniref:EPS8 signaling adaptor L3b n=1 Tax=Oryzias melastigma TaxID=30732 RepID=A0A3B3DWV4_ORYME